MCQAPFQNRDLAGFGHPCPAPREVSGGLSPYRVAAPTILALGDSITQGAPNYSCYRQFLIPSLCARGIPIQFIGPNEDAISAHAGYGGMHAHFLLDIVRRVYRQYPAEFVLLHAGHNCFSEDHPVPGLVRATEGIIREIAAINPQAVILLAQVIPAGKLPKYAYIPALNQELALLATRLAGVDFRVRLVNQADGFDWRTDTVGDQVHPNDSGAQKMAARWLEVLLPLLPTADPA